MSTKHIRVQLIGVANENATLVGLIKQFKAK